MNKTKIEWVRNPDGSQGYTWNPITGCLNGCPYCFARNLAQGRLEKRYLSNKNLSPDLLEIQKAYNRNKLEPFQDPFYPRFWPERLHDKDLRSLVMPVSDEVASKYVLGKSLGIFACDMSDLFGIGIPREWTWAVLDVIRSCPQHRFYLLTKQPQNLVKWSPFPENCWVGVSVDGTDNAPLGRTLYTGFDRIQAKVKFISFEPLLADTRLDPRDLSKDFADVHWLIIGAETGNRKEKPALSEVHKWAKEIIEAADEAGIPVFIKDNLKYPVKRQEWPLTK